MNWNANIKNYIPTKDKEDEDTTDMERNRQFSSKAAEALTKQLNETKETSRLSSVQSKVKQLSFERAPCNLKAASKPLRIDRNITIEDSVADARANKGRVEQVRPGISLGGCNQNSKI